MERHGRSRKYECGQHPFIRDCRKYFGAFWRSVNSVVHRVESSWTTQLVALFSRQNIGYFWEVGALDESRRTKFCSLRGHCYVVEIARSTYSNRLVPWVVSSRAQAFWLWNFAKLFVRGDTEIGVVVLRDNLQNTEHRSYFLAQINELWGYFGNFNLKWCTKKQMQFQKRCHFYTAMRSNRGNSDFPTLQTIDSKTIFLCRNYFRTMYQITSNFGHK